MMPVAQIGIDVVARLMGHGQPQCGRQLGGKDDVVEGFGLVPAGDGVPSGDLPLVGFALDLIDRQEALVDRSQGEVICGDLHMTWLMGTAIKVPSELPADPQ